ncbi:MAG TPA: hypothetical protein VF038_02915, partial [Usitatibacter sp.]
RGGGCAAVADEVKFCIAVNIIEAAVGADSKLPLNGAIGRIPLGLPSEQAATSRSTAHGS